MNAPLPADELNARYDPMTRDELIAECERQRLGRLQAEHERDAAVEQLAKFGAPVAWRYWVSDPYEPGPRWALSLKPREGAEPLYLGPADTRPAPLKTAEEHE